MKFSLIFISFLFINIQLYCQSARVYRFVTESIAYVTELNGSYTSTNANASVISRNVSESNNIYVEFPIHKLETNSKSVGFVRTTSTSTFFIYLAIKDSTLTFNVPNTNTSVKVKLYDKVKLRLNNGIATLFVNNKAIKSYNIGVSITERFKIKVTFTTSGLSIKDISTDAPVEYTITRSNLNYIHSIIPLEKTNVEAIATTGNRKTGRIIENIEYFDGLGRPIQTVHVLGTANGHDMVQPRDYVAGTGIEVDQFMPYPIKLSNGAYRANAISSEQNTILRNYLPGETKTSTENQIEASPLHRKKFDCGPGKDWVDRGKGVSYAYQTNASEVKLIKVSGGLTSNTLKISVEGAYAPNTLYKLRQTDEHGNITEEYKDLQQRVILKKTSVKNYVNSTSGTNKTVATYYVYDDYNRLRLVVPPMAAATIDTLSKNTDYSLSSDIIKKYCYYYEYDGRGRMIIKKLPGADEIYMVYNKRDLLVLMQDGVMRSQKKWMFTKYDIFNRPIMTGIYTTTTSLSQTAMQQQVDNAPIAGYEKPQNADPGYTTSNAFPSGSFEIWTVTYYDTYDYINSISGLNYDSLSNFNIKKTNRVINKITGSKVKILGPDISNSYVYTVNYYDDYGRIIQVKRKCDLDANLKENITTEYSFTGKPIKQRILNGYKSNRVMYYLYTYDHADRLVDTYIVFNDDTICLSHQTYNELDQLMEKNLHGSRNSGYIQSIDYAYNVRGWLTQINNTSLNDGDSDLFGMQLYYQDAAINPQYNGNISQITYTRAQKNLDTYRFRYDELNRLLSANYSSNQTGIPAGAYDFSAAYDENGNIVKFNQYYNKQKTKTPLDSILFTYNGNQLLKASDRAADSTDKYRRGDFYEVTSYDGNSASTEYNYDANGNMLNDYNRNYTVTYNLLNLPQTIQVDTDKIDYYYMATGEKILRKIKGITNYLYWGNFVYLNTNLSYILTPEGRIMNEGATCTYQYFLKDHLGNVRLTLQPTTTGRAQSVQEDHYYPFGLQMPALSPDISSPNPYLYNTKELQSEIKGLRWYDYGARMYDAQVGRWTTVDPSAETYLSWTSYNYCANNPINLIDIDGKDWYQWKDKNGSQAVFWREGNAKEIEVNGQKYANIGTTYTQNIGDGISIIYTQSEATSMTTNTMTSDQWVSQYSKPDWDGTPASKACNKACDAMLAKDGNSSSGMIVVVNNGGDGRAGTANENATNAISDMSKALDFDKPTKVNVDFRSGTGSGDMMGDHFVVVQGKTEQLSNGKVTSTAFHYFDPGTNNQSKGTSPSNILRVQNNRLVGTHMNNGLPIVVTSIRPTK